ncbi:MAG: helix-turn-helix domain-containing protein, partial [Candidatus Peregrinibacteria bacterium]|nr:helix-turn-helix domain-containing protein [Candidatus Peregrinibacteria bacterium]
MDLSSLTSIGLSEKSAKIYIASLNLGVSTVQRIAEKANIKRPTAYLHIQELLKDGYLQKIPMGKKECYAACDPQILRDQLHKNVQAFDSALPELRGIYKGFQGKLRVRVLEGQKALDAVYDDICNANQISFIADLISFEKSFQGAFDKISTAIRDKEIRTREIIPNTDEAKKSSKRYAVNAGKFYSSRIATNGPIHNDCAIYGNTIAFFRINEFNLFVILIEEPT